jgi:hypothetical protein
MILTASGVTPVSLKINMQVKSSAPGRVFSPFSDASCPVMAGFKY